MREADQTGPTVATEATATMKTSIARMLAGLKTKGTARSTAPTNCTKPYAAGTPIATAISHATSPRPTP